MAYLRTPPGTAYAIGDLPVMTAPGPRKIPASQATLTIAPDTTTAPIVNGTSVLYKFGMSPLLWGFALAGVGGVVWYVKRKKGVS